jgi:hypothetical protein
MESYLLLLHDSEQYAPLSPEEMQAVFARYKAWGQKLRDAGRILGSNKLEDGTGRVLRAKSGDLRITDGPFTETKDVLGGYFLVSAESYEDAVSLCRDCPHLDFGAIEVRRIQKL